jgi:hypothetical protein
MPVGCARLNPVAANRRRKSNPADEEPPPEEAARVVRRVKILWTMTIALCVCLAVAAAHAVQPPGQTILDVQKLGPQVGARVPDFSLTDQNGEPHTLRSVMGPKGAMLVFFRSADW